MHMCALKQSGFDKQDPAAFKKLTANPKYRCGNCGAQAQARKNLCKPVAL